MTATRPLRRVLPASAACGLCEEAFPELVRVSMSAYPEPAVLVALTEQMEAERGRLNTYHLAQAPLSHAARAALESALRGARRAMVGG